MTARANLKKDSPSLGTELRRGARGGVFRNGKDVPESDHTPRGREGIGRGVTSFRTHRPVSRHAPPTGTAATTGRRPYRAVDVGRGPATAGVATPRTPANLGVR